MAKNQKDGKVNVFVSLISDDEDEDMSEDESGRESPIPSPEPMEVQNASPSPTPPPTIPPVIETVQLATEATQQIAEPEPMEVVEDPEESQPSHQNETENLPPITQVIEKTDREPIAALPHDIAETVNTLIDIYENSRSPRVPLEQLNSKNNLVPSAQNEEPPEIINGSPDSHMMPVMDEMIPIIRNDFTYNSAPVQQIMETVSVAHQQPAVAQEIVSEMHISPEMHVSPEKIAPVVEGLAHVVVVAEKEPELVPLSEEFCPINDENVVLHEEIVAFTEEVVSETLQNKCDWTADIQVKVCPPDFTNTLVKPDFNNYQSSMNSTTTTTTRVDHEEGCISLCDKSNGQNLRKTSKTYPSKRKTKAELKSMEVPLTLEINCPDDFGPVLNQKQVKEYSIIHPNIPFLEQRLEHSSSEESIYDGSSFYATLDSEHVAEYVVSP